MPGVRTPWYERYSALLEKEIEAYAEAGLNLKLNETILEKSKVVVFEGSVEAKDGVHSLRVVYPAGFPDTGPLVFDLNHQYERHQNPYEGNLCLPDWQRGLTGAQLVTEAVNFFNVYHKGPYAVSSMEIDAPEPASTWYPYEDNSSVIVANTMTDFPDRARGEFTLKVLQLMPIQGLAQTIIERVFDAENRNEINFGDMGPLGSGISLAGPWIKVNSHPPYTLTTFEDFRDWCYSQNREKLEYSRDTLRGRIKKQYAAAKLDFELFGIVYPEEGPARSEYHDQWLVGLYLKHNGYEFKGLLRPSILGMGDLYFQRIPSLHALKDKHVVCIGLGSLGSPIAISLARVGVGHFHLIDYDTYDGGNFVRQEGDLRLAGLKKVLGIETLIRFINPNVTVESRPLRIGAPAPIKDVDKIGERSGDELSLLSEIISSADLVISTVADQSVEFLINEILVEQGKSGIFSSVTNGAWGGQVFRSLPDGACFQCYGYHKNDGATGKESFDPNELPLYVRGCGYPTFTGTGFDAGAIANLATRFAVQTLLRDDTVGYPDAPYNLITWNSRGEFAGDFPSIEKIALAIHPSCSLHSRSKS